MHRRYKRGSYNIKHAARIKKCEKCLKIGHDTDKCYSNLLPVEKSVNRITNDSQVDHKYLKTAFINNIPIQSFIDLGSECCILKHSYFLKLESFEVSTNDLHILRGFGNSVVNILGRINAYIEVDGVGANADILIVPDNVM
jgi:hypothetical protein